MAQCKIFLFLVCWGSSIGHAQGKAVSAFLGNCLKLSCFGFLWAMEAANRKWKKLGSKWKDMFPLDPGQPSLGSWLDEQDDPWGIGCRACHSAGCAGNLAQYAVATEGGLQSNRWRAQRREGKGLSRFCRQHETGFGAGLWQGDTGARSVLYPGRPHNDVPPGARYVSIGSSSRFSGCDPNDIGFAVGQVSAENVLGQRIPPNSFMWIPHHLHHEAKHILR
jgi:hypothetical protein